MNFVGNRREDPAHALFETGEELHFKKNQYILEADDIPQDVYLLTDGLVKVCSLNNQGEEFIHLFYGPGELFPLHHTFIPSPRRNVCFQASTDCKVLALPAAFLTKKLQNDSALSFSVLQKVTKQFNAYSTRIENLEYKFASERLAYRILFIAARFGVSKASGTWLPPMTQRDIAASINLSRESTNRELERFTRKGYIKHDGRLIIIADSDGLKAELHADVDFSHLKPEL